MFFVALISELVSTTTSIVVADILNNAVDTTTEFFSPWTYYFFPVSFLIYSIIIALKTNYELMAKVKRIYYSIMILALLLILKSVNLIGIGQQGLWGTTPKAWSVILFIIIYSIAIVLIDNYIISGYVFKEFGFFGTKFIKDDIKEVAAETVKSQLEYINSLESSIKAQYKMIERIKTNTKELMDEHLNFNVYIGNLITEFYANKNTDVQVETYNFDKGDYGAVIEKLTEQYNLDSPQITELAKRLKKNLFYYLKGKDNDLNLLHFVITSEFRPQYEIGIAIKMNGKYNLKDHYIITNLIYFFELCLVRLRKNR